MGKKTGRLEQILQELGLNGRIEVEVLSQQLKVNTSTIRRDLEYLERQGKLRRVHGGAVPADTLSYSAYANELTFQENINKNVDEKSQIAALAAQQIKPGDTIALSPGTTTTYLARAIRQLQITNLTVVTNAINIAMELSGVKDINLNLTGGLFLPDFFALVGPQAEQSLNETFVAKAFVGVTGLSVEHGLTGPNQLEALTHRLTLQRARKTYVLADHTKLDQVALYRICPLNMIHTIITDEAASPEIVNNLRNAGVEVLQPSRPRLVELPAQPAGAIK
ncbi:MAG: DeoR family transcriptional regulator [Chloroflexi bacterium]|nr:DeoR family transcriptional regulator [Chloroflexota bacterium]